MKNSRFPPVALATLAIIGLIRPSLRAQDDKPADAAPLSDTIDVSPSPAPGDVTTDESARLIAVMSPTEGNKTRGVVTFEWIDREMVRVTAQISGLTPNARHAIHIHEYGDLSAPDGTSAGGHFNSTSANHELPESENRHIVDFGNLQADAEGNTTHIIETKNLALIGKDDAIIGRAVVIHALEDKGPQPSGNAGDRIAQGVIAIANPDSNRSEVALKESETDQTISSPVVSSTATRTSANNTTSPVDTVERVAEKVGRGAEKAARTTVKAVERGAEEVGETLKKVGKEIEKIAD